MERVAFISLLLTAVFSLSVECRFHFVNQKMNWYDAQSYCRENYTDLATINNMKDTEDLLKIPASDTVWIGLKRNWSVPVLYVGNQLQYENWKSGHNKCVYMGSDGKCYDADCTTRHPFICYKDSSREYVVVNSSVNWTEAQSYCRENHTDLASVRNKSENQMIQQIIQNQKVWIGLFRDSWDWSDGSNSPFRNWQSEEPNSGDTPGKEICAGVSVSVNKGQWIDDCCDAPYPFVCYDDKLVLIRENKTWKDALRYCREHQMDLVSVESDWMQRRVIEVVKDASSEEVWIGLRLSCTLGLWFWVSGETLCYHNWAPGNGTGQEDCSVGVRAGVIQSGGDHRWISLPETYQLNFICSKY